LGIHIEYGEWKGNLLIPSGFKEVIKEIGFQEKRKLGEICFIFVSEKEILRINREYLKHDYVTDVITFSNNIKLSVSGDLFICPEMVFMNAVTYGSDNYTELFRVMIHGVLHLVGYYDGTDDEKGIMRGKENYYLDFGRANLHLNEK
jgi:probable rRNA maturation factor